MLKVSPAEIGAERELAASSPRARAGGRGDTGLPDDVSAHKFFAPAPYPGAIARGTILERIVGNRSVRVILLQGPAGHGKSTTLQQIKTLHEDYGWQTAWLTFDDADNDPRRFAIHIQALVDMLCHERTERSRGDEDAAAARRRRRADWVLDRFSRLQRPAAVFLDEFQALRNRANLTFFRDLFERLPDNVRIFVGSRSLPDVGLAKLLVNNVALVIKADDLRFSPREVDEFFAAYTELGVSGEEIETIYRRTEGWPAALQLYRLTLVSPEVRNSLDDLGSHSPRQLAEYLADNVLALQAARTRAFLLRTSLLTRLTAPLCNVVTGRQDSQAVLQELERSGLFVRSLDAEGQWFKYHGLFSTILAESFCRKSEAQAREVHARAAQWHLAQQQYEETVHHALACGDYALAADTLNVWAAQLTVSAHLMTVERWFDLVPLEHVVARPELAIKVAYALMFLRRHQKLRPVLEHLRHHAAMGATTPTANPALLLAMAEVFEDNIPRASASIDVCRLRERADEGFSAFELGAAANVVAFREVALGDFEAARKSLALARSFNDRGGATFSGGYTAAISGVCNLLQGQLHEALERFKREMTEPGAQIERSFASAALASCHIWALYESNDLNGVESICGQYHDDISGSVILDFIAVALVSMARTHDVRGRPDQALELLDEIERIGHDSGWARMIGVADWERVRRALAAGDMERAKTIAAHIPAPDTALPAAWISLAEDLGGESLGRIRLAIHAGELVQAGSLLTQEFARQPARTYRRMKLHLLESLLRQREGSHNAAHRSLRKALQLGGGGRYVRSFLDEGESIVRLLREEYQGIFHRAGHDDADTDEHRAFIEQLLEASGTDLSRTLPAAARTLLEPLSDRENEILVFLANGVSNREIAGRLFVSENTVKFHLKNIYAKLAVSSRLQAIAAARQLGLV
jgi:LuxR family maltose regulon positive regulatory protein